MGDAAASPQAAPGKRRRGGDGAGMRRVAEIVMVLAAAGEVRGGREPTAAERALAAEARERLAAAVADGAVRPRDLFPGEAVRAVVEDLGLNRARDPATMGFRPPKASIADRLMLTKRKMEEVKEAPVQPTTSAPQTTVSSGTAEFQGFHGPPVFGVGAHRNQPAVPASSASLVILKPPGSSPVKPVTNPSVVALPYTGQPHLKLDKGVNGPLNLTRGGATVGHLNKSLHDTSSRSNLNSVQNSNLVVKNQDTKSVSVQAATGNPVIGTAFVPSKPIFANHNEIAKNVQHILHQPANHPSWTPPSTEYMHACLDCQICKNVIIDADSLLVCDACERGAHLKCLQHYGNKGVPKAEWHCPTCLAQNKGKPLPPKYGKVTRTVVAPKVGPPGGGTQLSGQGVAENRAAKENHQKVAANGNLIKPKSMQAGITVRNNTVLPPDAATAGLQSQSISISRPAKESVNNAETSSNEKEGNGQPCSSTAWHNVKSPDDLQSSESAAGSITGIHSEKSSNEKASSGLSLHSVDSANDTMHGQQPTIISGVNFSDNSFPVSAEARIKSKAHSEALLSRDVEMVDNSGTPMDQTSNISTEEKTGTRATSEPDTMKDVDMTTNTGTPIDEDSNVATEEKVHTEATSEPHMIKNVEMTTNTGTPIYEGSNVATEQKIRTDATSESHTMEYTEMTANTATTIDQSSVATEEKPQSELTSAVKDAELIANAGIPTDQTQQANRSTENGVREPPNGEAYKDKSDCNAMSDHHSTHQVISNGVLHPKGEDLCSQEGEVAGCSAAPSEEAN